MIAFRAVENPYFIKMMEDLNVTNSGIKIPGRRSLRKKIAKQSFDQICEIKENLAEVKYLCTPLHGVLEPTLNPKSDHPRFS